MRGKILAREENVKPSTLLKLTEYPIDVRSMLIR